MPKIELTITTDYVPEWDAWCGIREFIQNAQDAQTEYNAPMAVDWHNDTLRIENTGVTLPHESLLLGYTSKADRDDMIGGKAEGYKLGTLALVRAGHTVKIRSGDEVWTASIETSEKFNAKVLTFNIKGGNEDKKRVRVEIGGVTKDVWESLRGRFLFLTKIKAASRVETEYGDLLLGPDYGGKLFVKGIFVQYSPALRYGYNFKDAEVDRDRKVVSQFNVEWEASKIWSIALAKRPDLVDPFFQMMLDNTGNTDLAGVEHNAHRLPKDAQANIAAQFLNKFGGDALPVANLAESSEVGHLGKRGIIVSKSLGAVLAEVIGTKDDVLKATREEVVRTLSWNDMADAQQGNLLDAITLVERVRPACTLALVSVVEFRSPNLLGQFKKADKRICLAARLLDDRDELLATLVHEFSHFNGGDGEKEHVMAIENLWRDIVKALRATVAS